MGVAARFWFPEKLTEHADEVVDAHEEEDGAEVHAAHGGEDFAEGGHDGFGDLVDYLTDGVAS